MRALVVLAVVLSGCGYTRVTLKPADDPDGWEALQPVGVRSSTMVLMRGPGTPEFEGPTAIDAVVLRNKVEVADPRDLIPVVRPGSRTALLAAEWGEGAERWRGFQVAAGATFVGGLLFLLVPAVSQLGHTPGTGGVALGITVGGPILSAVLGALLVGNIDHKRLAAFRSFAGDLGPPDAPATTTAP